MGFHEACLQDAAIIHYIIILLLEILCDGDMIGGYELDLKNARDSSKDNVIPLSLLCMRIGQRGADRRTPKNKRASQRIQSEYGKPLEHY
jgi:hypothetical protein